MNQITEPQEFGRVTPLFKVEAIRAGCSNSIRWEIKVLLWVVQQFKQHVVTHRIALYQCKSSSVQLETKVCFIFYMRDLQRFTSEVWDYFKNGFSQCIVIEKVLIEKSLKFADFFFLVLCYFLFDDINVKLMFKKHELRWYGEQRG